MKVSLGKVKIVAVILLLIYAANFVYALASDQSGGTFGDTFGAVNALFSGSALFFLVLAFLSQREELQLIKDEREDTRELLAGQEESIRQQRMALDRQIFTQSFDSRLNLVIQERARISVRPILHGVRSESEFNKSAQISLNILLNSKTSDEKKSQFRDHKGETTPTHIYLRLLMSLDTILQTAELDSSEQLKFSNLITGMSDKPTSCSMFALALEELEESGHSRTVVDFAARYDLIRHFETDERKRVFEVLPSFAGD